MNLPLQPFSTTMQDVHYDSRNIYSFSQSALIICYKAESSRSCKNISDFDPVLLSSRASFFYSITKSLPRLVIEKFLLKDVSNGIYHTLLTEGYL